MRKFISILFFILFLPGLAHSKMPQAGDPAPDFSLTSIQGEEFSLSDLKGKVVLVGMFHICVPCMNQAMEFNKVRKELDTGDLVILGINTSGDSKKAVMEYLAGFPTPVSFPYLLDPEQSVHKAYIQRDMPTVLIIDKEGILRARIPSVSVDQLVPFLKKLL